MQFGYFNRSQVRLKKNATCMAKLPPCRPRTPSLQLVSLLTHFVLHRNGHDAHGGASLRLSLLNHRHKPRHVAVVDRVVSVGVRAGRFHRPGAIRVAESSVVHAASHGLRFQGLIMSVRRHSVAAHRGTCRRRWARQWSPTHHLPPRAQNRPGHAAAQIRHRIEQVIRYPPRGAVSLQKS